MYGRTNGAHVTAKTWPHVTRISTKFSNEIIFILRKSRSFKMISEMKINVANGEEKDSVLAFVLTEDI